MEVPNKSQTRRQKWAHYFWEFFMLFLAVTLGFFVENLREHRIARKREKGLMQSMLVDLKADTAHINAFRQARYLKNQACDSLISLLTVAPKENDKNLIYYYGRTASRRTHFYSQDATLQQLENSGGFVVIHDQAILDSINSYRLLLKFNLENIEVEEKELSEYTQVAASIFDVNTFQQMVQTGEITRPEGNPALLTYDPKLINELCIKLHYWKRTSLTILSSYDRLKENSVNLIQLIRKKYHFK